MAESVVPRFLSCSPYLSFLFAAPKYSTNKNCNKTFEITNTNFKKCSNHPQPFHFDTINWAKLPELQTDLFQYDTDTYTTCGTVTLLLCSLLQNSLHKYASQDPITQRQSPAVICMYHALQIQYPQLTQTP
jgi:hypothetical protein